jgi:signal transduction histidine kinase
MHETPSASRVAAAIPTRPEPDVRPRPGPPAGRAGDSAEITLRLIEERDRIAQDMNDIVVRRLFSAALDLEAALGLVSGCHAAGKIQHAVDELDLAIRDLRDAVFDYHHHDPAAGMG